MNMWKMVKRYGVLAVMGILTVTGGVLVQTERAFAGEVNAYERQLLDMMYEQYEYEGTVYVVDSVYINTAYHHFKSDDVDLTEEGYQTVLNQLQNNIAQGVETGYLIPYVPPETETVEPPETESSTIKNVIPEAPISETKVSETSVSETLMAQETTQTEETEPAEEEDASEVLRETEKHTVPAKEIAKLEELDEWIEQVEEEQQEGQQEVYTKFLGKIQPPGVFISGTLLTAGVLLAISAAAACGYRLFGHHSREEREHAEE